MLGNEEDITAELWLEGFDCEELCKEDIAEEDFEEEEFEEDSSFEDTLSEEDGLPEIVPEEEVAEDKTGSGLSLMSQATRHKSKTDSKTVVKRFK